MNTSHHQYMDKIIDLSSSTISNHQNRSSFPSNDFVFMNSQDHHHGGNTATYDFQPVGPISSKLDGLDGGSVINSTSSFTRHDSSFDALKPANINLQKQNEYDIKLMADIDQVMKYHIDKLLNVLNGISGRLTQLESQTHTLENSMNDLKVSSGNNQASTDGKIKQLENILREVHTGVELIKENGDKVEALFHFRNEQVSKEKIQPGSHTMQAASAPPQSPQQLLPATFPQSVPPTILLPPNQLLQHQTPLLQPDNYYVPHTQTQEAPLGLQYQHFAGQQPQLPPAAAPQQPYQSANQPPQLQQYNPDERRYMHQNYLSQTSNDPLPSEHYYYKEENPSNRFYGQPAGSESYPYSAPPRYGGNSPVKPQQSSPQLPTARVLPQALPTASGVGSELETNGSGNIVPVDDVINKVMAMGFPKDQVRATVRTLTENSQSVDLNMVLDKLMNG